MKKLKIKIKGNKQIVTAFNNKGELVETLKAMLKKLPKDCQRQSNVKVGKLSRFDITINSIWNLGEEFLPTSSLKSSMFPNIIFRPFKRPRPLILS